MIITPIKINKLSKQSMLTVDVVLTKQFMMRTKIAIWLMKLAAKILGCDVAVEVNGKKL